MAGLHLHARAPGRDIRQLAVHTVVPTWRTGDTMPLGAGRTLRMVAIRDNDADQPPALVVQSA
jgi:hypothetical protein